MPVIEQKGRNASRPTPQPKARAPRAPNCGACVLLAPEYGAGVHKPVTASRLRNTRGSRAGIQPWAVGPGSRYSLVSPVSLSSFRALDVFVVLAGGCHYSDLFLLVENSGHGLGIAAGMLCDLGGHSRLVRTGLRQSSPGAGTVISLLGRARFRTVLRFPLGLRSGRGCPQGKPAAARQRIGSTESMRSGEAAVGSADEPNPTVGSYLSSWK
jgi:hypothetical protein